MRGKRTDFGNLPEYRWRAKMLALAQAARIDNPFFRVHQGRAGAETRIEGKTYINFASYDYLGLNGEPRVAAAAIAAIEQFGTSVSASRLVAGERPFHGALERQLADFYGVEDALVMVSGHATNVSIIGQMLGPQDLLVHDDLIHNSVVIGGQLSRATRLAFPHNDLARLAEILFTNRHKHRRCLIAVEGLYSMDGDIIDLQRLVELKRQHEAWLLVDEAHALGVLGRTGRGSGEHCGVAGPDVDIWMGTLSKTLASAGGYIAGSAALIDYAKAAAPGFVYSVGLPPPNAAAAAAALAIMIEEPERVAVLQRNCTLMHGLAQAAGFNTGSSVPAAILPLRIGDSVRATLWANALFAAGVNVLPIVYPAVPYDKAILRFFVTAAHSETQIETAMAAAERTLAQVMSVKLPSSRLLAAGLEE